MDTPVKPPRPERDATDESLRAERKNLDRAIAERREGRREEADELVDLARERADAVLDEARHEADERRAGSGLGGEDVVAERSIQDAALEDERAAADERLARERAAETRALAALLPLEREKTDRFLLTERARSDDSVANRDDFLAIVGHDLRNLLSGIVLDATLVTERASTSDEGRRAAEAMQRIQRHAARMNRLIGDLVDVVSIDAGKLAVDPGPCDVAALLAEAVDGFAGLAAERGVGLELEIAQGAMMAELDHDRMLQVLANLLTNALKFTPRGGWVVVGAERLGESIRLSVSDTGPGIPADLLEVVFDRFWQADQGDRRGLGLGLYISRSLVEAHGGRIWVDSEPGAGSTFRVVVPAGPQPLPAP
jgi:signal transduction histidine kinase